MTVLSTDHLVGTSRATLPRVNLLPPEIAAQRAFRRVQVGLGAAVLGTLGLAGMMYASAAHGVSSAQGDLDAATAQRTALQSQVRTFDGVQKVYADAELAKAQLVTAMSDEVRYSQFLNDMSLLIPSNVWITDVKLAKKSGPAVPASAPATPTAGLAAAAAATGPVTLGELSFKGVGFSHDDVATWLDALVKVDGLSDIYFDKSAEARIGNRLVVNFDSTATVTSKMQSGRYKKAS